MVARSDRLALTWDADGLGRPPVNHASERHRLTIGASHPLPDFVGVVSIPPRRAAVAIPPRGTAWPVGAIARARSETGSLILILRPVLQHGQLASGAAPGEQAFAVACHHGD